MKNLLAIIVSSIFFSMMSQNESNDLQFLNQNWSFSQYKAGNIQEITYKSSAAFGNFYGYQFRKNGTMTISRSVGKLPRNLQDDFEEVDGTWKIIQDSILTISYKSNNKSYVEKLVIRQLNANELVVHPLDSN